MLRLTLLLYMLSRCTSQPIVKCSDQTKCPIGCHVKRIRNMGQITPELMPNCTEGLAVHLDNNTAVQTDSGPMQTSLCPREIRRSEMAVMSKLKILVLQGNCISHIEDGTFMEMEELNRLILSKNNLSRLFKGTLQGLTKLTKLWLSGNQISEIDDGAFTDLRSLKYMRIRSNCIARLRKKTFTGLRNLLKLELQHNIIFVIDDGSFQELTSLKGLYLRGNRISHLGASTFLGLINITYLDLISNNISQVEAGTFYATPNLLKLELSKNKIVFLTWDIFVLKTEGIRKPKLKDVHLYFNKISCGKENCWMKEMRKKRWLHLLVGEKCWDDCPDSSMLIEIFLNSYDSIKIDLIGLIGLKQ